MVSTWSPVPPAGFFITFPNKYENGNLTQVVVTYIDTEMAVVVNGTQEMMTAQVLVPYRFRVSRTESDNRRLGTSEHYVWDVDLASQENQKGKYTQNKGGPDLSFLEGTESGPLRDVLLGSKRQPPYFPFVTMHDGHEWFQSLPVKLSQKRKCRSVKNG